MRRRRCGRAAPLTLPVRVTGLAPGEEARVTVAAVDVGILNLTRYEAPNPDEYFFGQRQLGTEIRDLYGYLIDGMQGTRGAIRFGGDAAAGIEGSPPAQEPLARYSGVVTVGPDGTAEVTFDVPAFNGTRAGHGGRLVEGPGRQRHRRRDRPRSRRARRHVAALPLGGRPVALLHAARQRRGPGGGLHGRSRHPRTGRRSGGCAAQDGAARGGRQGVGHHSGHGGGARDGDVRRQAVRAGRRNDRSVSPCAFSPARRPWCAGWCGRSRRPPA